MASPFAIRAALAASIAHNTGYRTYERWTESPEPPCFIIDWDEPIAEYDKAMSNGLNQFNFIAKIISGKLDDDAAQQLLDELIDSTGGKSMKLAVRQDNTLAGTVADCRVTQVSNFGATTVGGNNMISAIFHIVVYAP